VVPGMASGIVALKRLPLAHLPTPLEPAPGLAAALGCPGLLVKREDLSGLGEGGNKPRQLEVLLAEAEAAGADTLLTTAGPLSNFCRAAAAASARLGWRCVLLLRGDGSIEPRGNLLLDHLFGAEIRWVATDDPYADIVQERLDTLEAELRRAGRRPYQLRLPGRAGAMAAAAAAGLAEELADQWPEPAATVALATGSGLTAAGLLAGFAMGGHASRVLALSVQQPAGFIRPLILRRAAEALALLGSDAVIDPSRLEVDDRFIAPGYGVPSEAALEAVALAGRTAGLVLDPAYTAKALAGLHHRLAQGEERTDGPLIFVHTGSGPGFFGHAETVRAYLLNRVREPAGA